MPLPEIVRVPLTPAVAEAVRALAYAELRDAPRQAAWLVTEALRQRGVLSEPRDPEQETAARSARSAAPRA
jgi:hypothetical protein